jgi:hypothetical protein
MNPANDQVHPPKRCSIRESTLAIVPVVFFSIVVLCGCDDFVPRDMKSLLFPKSQHSEISGSIAVRKTTFAALPDRFNTREMTLYALRYGRALALSHAVRSGIVKAEFDQAA